MMEMKYVQKEIRKRFLIDTVYQLPMRTVHEKSEAESITSVVPENGNLARIRLTYLRTVGIMYRHTVGIEQES
jgi:hypothetical protein